MWKNALKINSLKVILRYCACILLSLCAIWSVGFPAYAAEGELAAQEKYEEKIDKAIGLADLLRTSPELLHNKLYTAEQEVELQALVDSVCAGQSTDYMKVERLLQCIYERLEPGSCEELNAWDTLCDGDSGWYNSSGELAGTKNQVGEMEYCYTFYDVCRLEDIPCFILGGGTKYIAMVYLEKEPGAGKEWYFVDVASEKETFVTINRENVYEKLAERISYPDRLALDYYDQSRYYRDSIFLENLYEDERSAPNLVYDSDTDTVKGYFPNGGYLAAGEQYGRTESYFGDDGEAPSGLIESKYYDEGKVTIYRSYAVYGVFLRGRVEWEGEEYDLQAEYDNNIPFYAQNAVKTEPESEEHKAFVKNYQKQLEDKAIAVADALLADENYIWKDLYFPKEEDEKLVRDAVEQALDWDYIQSSELSQIAFENVGIPYVPWEEQSPEFMDKAKAQAILLYIKRNVESVEHGFWDATSADVLRGKAGICAGIAILFRDMCVIADIPCFRLQCALNMKLGDSYFLDHIDNMIKVGDEWLFCDPTNVGLIGKGGCIQAGFMDGYDAQYNTLGDTKLIYIDREVACKNNYLKWEGYGTMPKDYFEFDDDGTLAIYRRYRWGEPMKTSMTDENGRYTRENGLHTIDVKEETDGVETVTRYAYYYQNLRNLQGRQTIDGTEYDFSTNITGEGHGYHKLQEVSRRYAIGYLDFQPLADQPYHKDGVCPMPEIYHGDKKLELGKDFEIVEYRNNKELSTNWDATYKVKGLGDYFGEAARQFKITAADVSQLDVKLSQTSFIWKPSGLTGPEVEVPGLDSEDYKVEYVDSNKVGTASVVVTGRMNSKTRKTNVTGSVTLEYEILPYQMQAEDIQAEYTETTYNGSVQKPEVTVAGFDQYAKKYYVDVSYEKMVDGAWQETEPKEAGVYRIAVQMTDNVELIKDGETIPNTYYIGYSIQPGGSSTTPELTLITDGITLAVGKTAYITAFISPASAADQTVIWTSSNDAWATVNEKGLVTTKEAGAGHTVTITAALQGYPGITKTAAIKILASDNPDTPGGTTETPAGPLALVSGITITPDTARVTAGGTVKLTASVLPENAANKNIIWTSSNSAWATVDEEGLVTATAEGAGHFVAITASAAANTSIKSSTIITVLAPGTPDTATSDTTASTNPAATPDITASTNPAEKPDTTSTKPTKEPDAAQSPKPTEGASATDGPLEGTVLQDTQHKVSYQVVSPGSTVTFYKVNDKKAAKAVVPDTVTIDGTTYKVTAVSAQAFNGCKKLKSVTIGKSVTAIGEKAFFKCTALEKITIPASVAKIGKKAFYGCKKLKSITIKTKKLKSTSVGAQAFKGIHKKAVIKVPGKQKKAYEKWLRKKGITKKMKIK
ncbi:MAG: leucine-rich repeat protein [Clostridium sp.]|nr:leucine-rich repeat protein [Clostridium sp.]